MNSLPSINPQTIVKMKVAISALGEDAKFMADLMESIAKITSGTGYGKISIYIQDHKISLLRGEETRSYSDSEEKRFD